MNFIAIASLVIQAIIAVFLIWYAFETFKLRKEASYQREIAIQPLLDFVYESKDPPLVLTIENVGSGVAMNLHLYMWFSEESKMLGLPHEQRPSILKPNSKIRLGPLKDIDTSSIKKRHPKLNEIIEVMVKQQGVGTFAAIYEDSAGNTYYSQQHAFIGADNPLKFGRL
jgi:hypothetical protein